MTLEEAIKHAEEAAKEQDKLCKRYDDASGYSRSHNEAIRTTNAKRCEECAEEHRQLAEWLRELKQLKEQKPYVTTRKLSDNELKHLVEQMEKERWQFISVKQDHCDDAISRKAAKAKIKSICNEYRLAYEDGERISGSAYAFGHAFDDLPSVSPQPKMGRWFIDERPECNREVVCSNCEQPVFKYHKLDFDYRPNYCPNCGAKME